MAKDNFQEMRKAKEEEYFAKKNRESLERLKQQQEGGKPRLSPITGEPMVQEVIHGVVIDRCTKSNGIWLDEGELEKLIEASKSDKGDQNSLITDFFKSFTG